MSILTRAKSAIAKQREAAERRVEARYQAELDAIEKQKAKHIIQEAQIKKQEALAVKKAEVEAERVALSRRQEALSAVKKEARAIRLRRAGRIISGGSRFIFSGMKKVDTFLTPTSSKKPKNALKSKKRGKIYETKIGRGKVLSRRPLGRRRR